MAEQEESGGSLWKYFVGMLIGMSLSYVYVHYDWSLPQIVTIGGKISSEAEIVAIESELYDPRTGPDTRKRAFEVVVQRRAKEIVQLDEELGNPVFEEFLRREAVKRAKHIKHLTSGYDAMLKQPALRAVHERRMRTTDPDQLKRGLLIQRIQDDEFLRGYLNERFPDAGTNGQVELVLGVYQNELRPQLR